MRPIQGCVFSFLYTSQPWIHSLPSYHCIFGLLLKPQNFSFNSTWHLFLEHLHLLVLIFPLASFKVNLRFHWQLSGKESACQCRRQGFDPWSRKLSHAMEWLNPCATAIQPVLSSARASTTKPTCHNYWSPVYLEPMGHKTSHCNEKPMHHHWK